jgi:outer membrane protein assembly factor BamB
MFRTCVIALVAAVAAVGSFVPGTRGDTTIDVSRVIKVNLPATNGLTPVAFRTSDGKEGWVVQISNQSIPTPAYANGRIFTGGGMSSNNFMAIDAATGKTVWNKVSRENGPTSPVVSGKYVCYNTESCDTETREIETGNLVWSETTGGTLMTQPVISGGMLVVPHPTMARTSRVSDTTFRMLSVEIATGEHNWDAPMTGDVLGAPISDRGRVFFACTDGRVFGMNSRGIAHWNAVVSATSAPVVVGQLLAVTTEQDRPVGGVVVSIKRFNIDNGQLIDKEGLAPVVVGNSSIKTRAAWDYQGPKIASVGRKLFNAPGQTINSVDLDTGKTLWQTTVKGDGVTNASDSLTPPALGAKNLYVGTSKGHIMAVKQENGMLAYAYSIGTPLLTQPLLVDGNLYFGTGNGKLVCLKMNDADAKGWTAWGGNESHNKVE